MPGNRVGYTVMSVAQLKILQEAITRTVFEPFALLYLKEPLKLDSGRISERHNVAADAGVEGRLRHHPADFG